MQTTLFQIKHPYPLACPKGAYTSFAFIINYFNDLSPHIINSNTLYYADGTVIYHPSDDFNKSYDIIQN